MNLYMQQMHIKDNKLSKITKNAEGFQYCSSTFRDMALFLSSVCVRQYNER
jgi:hypothetical protein